MKNDTWELLGLEPSATKRDVKRAYARKLKQCRPDEDPEGFQKLRVAYEQAIEWAENPAPVDSFVSIDDLSLRQPTTDEIDSQPIAAATHEPDALEFEVAGVMERVEQVVTEVLHASTPDAALRLVVAGETSLESRELLEQRLFDVLCPPTDRNPLLVAAVSHSYGWTEPGGRAAKTIYCGELILLEGAYESLLHVRHVSKEGAPIDEVIAANILLGDMIYELEYDNALNSLGSKLAETYGPDWNRFLAGSNTVEAWLNGDASDSPFRDSSVSGGVGCLGLIVLFFCGKPFIETVFSGDIMLVPASVLIAVGLVVTGFIMAWAAGRWG